MRMKRRIAEQDVQELGRVALDAANGKGQDQLVVPIRDRLESFYLSHHMMANEWISKSDRSRRFGGLLEQNSLGDGFDLLLRSFKAVRYPKIIHLVTFT